MASKRDRLRRLERARIERRIARQAHHTRRKRQIQAGVGAALALILIVVGVTWLLGGFDDDPAERQTVATGDCTWNLTDVAAVPTVTDVGYPSTTLERRTGTEVMTFKTNLGDIEATIDLSKAPCTALSFEHLSAKKYYDGSRCHRLNTTAQFLHCGDSSGNGSGNPAYTFANEDLPDTPLSTTAPTTQATPSASPGASPSAGAVANYYAKGTVVLANTGENTNSGQFYIIYGSTSDLGPAYSIVGTVTKGLNIIEDLAKAGAADSGGQSVADGNPVKDLIIKELVIGSAAPSPSAPSPSAPATPSSAPSPSAPATPSASPSARS